MSSAQHIKDAAKQAFIGKEDERILVVKRDDLFPNGAWNGLKQVDFDWYLKTISDKKEFLWRSAMETDPAYKQIIPYLIFEHDSRYFVMQRQKKASETRLQSKFSVGIGGHIRQEDMQEQDIFAWAKREFEEEVSYTGSYSIEPLGILNDDSNAVGQVHVGFVFLLKGDCDDIAIKDEHASGKMMALEEIELHYDALESWSSIVIDFLKQ